MKTKRMVISVRFGIKRDCVRKLKRLCLGIFAVLAMDSVLTSKALAQQLPAPVSASGLAAPDLAKVRALLTQGRYDVAETELRRAISQAPETAEPRFLLAFVLFKQQRAKDSLAAYTEAARLRRPTADEFVVIASDYVLLDDLADAQRWLTVATAEAPQKVEAWYLLGRTEYRLDHPEQAKAAFLTCLRLDPAHVRARYNLGLTYVRLQQPAEAAAAYEQAIKATAASPHPDAQPYLDFGMLLASENKGREALPLLQEAVRLAPRNPSAHEQLALCLQALGRDAEAAAEMLLCEQLAPEVAAPAFFLGRIYRRLGRTAEAKAQFERAAHLSGTQSSKEVPNPASEN